MSVTYFPIAEGKKIQPGMSYVKLLPKLSNGKDLGEFSVSYYYSLDFLLLKKLLLMKWVVLKFYQV